MTQTNKQKIKDAVRMVGHLLETNGTKGWFARDKNGLERDYNDPQACAWCLVGAMAVISEKFGLDKYSLDPVVAKTVGIKKSLKRYQLSSYYPVAKTWDDSDAESRKRIIKALKEIQ